MKISRSKHYDRAYKSKIERKHKTKEIETIKNIEDLIVDSDNLKNLLGNPLSYVYNINNKSGNLKEIYTANVNQKIRLYMKPVGKYPYNEIEITEMEFIEIDDQHYGDG